MACFSQLAGRCQEPGSGLEAGNQEMDIRGEGNIAQKPSNEMWHVLSTLAVHFCDRCFPLRQFVNHSHGIVTLEDQERPMQFNYRIILS